MALNILPNVPSTGKKAGESFAQGIGNVLNMLTQNKLDQIRERQYRSRMSDAFDQQPDQQAAEPNTFDFLQPQARGPVTKQEALDQSLQGGLNPQQALEDMAQENVKKTVLQEQTNKMKSQQPWEILQQKPRGKAQTDIYKAAHAEQNKIDKTLAPRLEKIDNAAGAAKKDANSFNVLRRAINSGKLTPASWARFRHAVDKNAKTIGGGLGGAVGALIGGIAGTLIPGVGTFAGGATGATAGSGLGSAIGSSIPEFVGSPLDQAFNKTVYGFMRNAKEIFGARIPVAEMEMFLQTLPTLRMDDSAKLAVIDQMESVSKLAEAQYKAKNDIIREHGGHAPANLMELIDQRIEPEIQKIADGITQTIERLIAEESGESTQSKKESFVPHNPWDRSIVWK